MTLCTTLQKEPVWITDSEKIDIKLKSCSIKLELIHLAYGAKK